MKRFETNQLKLRGRDFHSYSLVHSFKGLEVRRSGVKKSVIGHGARVCVAAFIVLLTGCSREIDVKGEAFLGFGTNVLPRAGTQVFLLSEMENRAFAALIEKRRQRHRVESFNAYRALTNQIGVAMNFEEVTGPADLDSDPLLALHRKHFPKDERTIHEILMELAREAPQQFKQFPESVKHWIQVQMPLHRDALDLEAPEQISFLRTCMNVTAGSDARFQIKLKKSQPYYVVAEDWWFRFVPNGQDLVLSDENRSSD